MTLTIYWTLLPDGLWIAVCDLHPGWRYKSTDQDKPAAETSLKRHASRNTNFQHQGWDGRV